MPVREYALSESMRAQAVPAFRFVVDVDGERQGAFTECTLPVIEWDVERIQEGGLNTYIHQLPSRRKYATITLKNGIGLQALVDWCTEAMDETFSRKSVTITMLDSALEPVMTYHIEDAVPTKLTGPQVKTDANALAIVTFELLCGEITLS
jgi:phage tail-like protein